jgi:hypothetical protein
MTSWRHTSAFMVVVALMLDAYTGVWAQGSIKRTDTFEQRYPPDQVPTPPVGEKPPSAPPVREAPIQPPADQLRARPNPLKAGPPSSPGGEQPKKVAMATLANRASTRRSRLVVPPRSFLDAGTEVLPGQRKFLDYALPPTHTPMDVVQNTGGRVGWHNSPLPGPFFPW